MIGSDLMWIGALYQRTRTAIRRINAWITDEGFNVWSDPVPPRVKKAGF